MSTKEVKVPNVKPKAAEGEEAKMEAFLEQMKAKKTINLVNLDGKTHVEEAPAEPQTDLKQIPTVIIKNCKNCTFTFNCRLAKVFMDNVSNCTVTFNGAILTRTGEFWHGDNLTININTQMKTLQLDMLETCTVNFDSKEHFKGIIWNQVTNLGVNFADSKTDNILTGWDQVLVDYPDSLLATEQFIVRFLKGKLTSEQCIRLRNGHLSTEREAVDWEKRNGLLRDRHMEKFLKNAGLHLNQDKNKVKQKPNAKCACNSGLKFKKCCMNKKEVTGLAGDKKITFKDTRQ
jgi:hypothetical protein